MRTLLFLSVILVSLSGFGQQAGKPVNDRIFVHTNSSFLLTGETLYFNVFCRHGERNTASKLSKVAYVELVNEQGRPVFQAKVLLKSGNGHGDFFIPSNFSSGNYTLIGYTRWMKNFSDESFFRKEIMIVNPFMRSTDVAVNGSKPNAPVDTARAGALRLKLETKKYKTRAGVTLSLSSPDDANVSISVRKKDQPVNDPGSMPGTLNAGSHEYSAIGAQPLLPEIRGHLITGTLTPKEGSPSKKKILASIPGTDFVLRAVSTDDSGKFNLIVDNFPEYSAMLFQVVDDDISNYTVKIDNPFLDDYSKFLPKTFSLDNDLRKIVDERSIYMQIENAYYETRRDSVLVSQVTSFYGTPDKVYRLDDFTRFPTMEDVFREYVPEVVTRLSKGVFSLYVVNATGFPYFKEPLLLIDGLPVLETNALMAFDPLKVQRIEIIRSRYVYGSLEAEGIISLKTYDGNMEDLPPVKSHRENHVRMQSEKVYPFPEYVAGKKDLERIPDYRLQLYWDVDVAVSKEAQTITFYTSDVPGDYEIVVEGFSVDGKPVSNHEVFSVMK